MGGDPIRHGASYSSTDFRIRRVPDEFKVQKIRSRAVLLTLRVLKADRRPPPVNSRFGSLGHARSEESRREVDIMVVDL